jgi:hypothetical protein
VWVAGSEMGIVVGLGSYTLSNTIHEDVVLVTSSVGTSTSKSVRPKVYKATVAKERSSVE